MSGRGRGRGRAGPRRGGRRGGRGGMRSRNRHPENTSDDIALSSVDINDLDVNKHVTDFFLGNASVDQHYDAQKANRDRYTAGMMVLKRNGVDVAQNANIRALAAAWARQDHALADYFLQDRDYFGVNEVLKALSLLDSGRQIRVLEKKLKRLQVSPGKVNAKTLGKLKSDIDNLMKNKPSHGSASGAVSKHVKRWVKRFTKDELEFYALHFPKEPWQKLADLCHLHPTQDFPELPWFLPFCFGGSAPEGSMVEKCREVTDANVNELLVEYPIPYAHVKKHISSLTEESKARIAASEPKLDTVLWWYEDLRCAEVDKVITERLKTGSEVTLSNGKLLERLLTMKMYRENIPIKLEYPFEYTRTDPDESKAPFYKDLLPLAQKKIDGVGLSLESPIVVLGDASYSMDVAIRTSTIIAGLLTAMTSSKLVFFDDTYRPAPYLPKTIEEVLELAVDTRLGGGTSPAISLLPFYEKKEVVKTFIIVTDEEENGVYTVEHEDGTKEHMYFDALFQKYHDEVYPSNLVFVSFLSNQHAEGDMVHKLRKRSFSPLQFKLNGSRPDLTKLDKLFGMLNTGSSTFEDELTELESKIKDDGLQKVFESLKL